MGETPSVDDIVRLVEARGVSIPPGRVHLDWFGDSAELSEKLIGLIRNGPKRAGTGLLWDYEAEGEEPGAPGDIEIVLSHVNEPELITRITRVRVMPFGDVDEEYAAIEGEGDRSLAYWREAHWDYFSRRCRELGREPSEDMPVVCTEFEVLIDLADHPPGS